MLPTIDVTNFDIGALLRCGRAIREATRETRTVSEAAAAVTRLLYDVCVNPGTGERTCALVRFYRTDDYARLDPSRRAFVTRLLGDMPATPDMKTLVLLATVGEEPAWNDPARSRAHRVIPLPSEEIVRQAPMIAQLIEQFGLEVNEVVRPAGLLREREGRTYNVFHVPVALGSPYIPAQEEFVIRYGIQSVVGFGGLLRSGNLFAVVLFSRVPIPPESARRFQSLAVDVKGALFFLEEPLADTD
ncbi:MAG TPA: hypothetical protein VMM18_10460 [Gemmatimonadaceae bacterium]|nr:hypothetical protein [Gemmatimonadaceae bacterium]